MCSAEQLPSTFFTEDWCLSDNCLLTRDAATWQVLFRGKKDSISGPMELNKASCLVWSDKCREGGKPTPETSELDQKDYRLQNKGWVSAREKSKLYRLHACTNWQSSSILFHVYIWGGISQDIWSSTGHQSCKISCCHKAPTIILHWS